MTESQRSARAIVARGVGVLIALSGTAMLPLAIAAPASAADPVAGAVASDPVIANPGFEEGLTGWTTSGVDGGAKIEAGGFIGASRMTHYLSVAGSIVTRQSVAGLSEGWWTVSAAVKSGSGLNTSSLRLENCGVDSRTVIPSTVTDDAWLRLSVSAYVSGGTCDVVVETSGATGAWASVDDLVLSQGSVDRTVRGADLSGVAKNEDFGATYFDSAGTSVVDPIQAFSDAGANLGRLKVWVNPADGYNDVEHVVASAKRIKAAGMQLLVDFHYSDRWTDPGQQRTPAAWAAFTPEQLATAVYDHTHQVLSALGDAGIVADAVQVGNEINPGMLWPLGQTYDVDPADAVTGAQWDNLASFLSAGARAVKAIDPDTDVILHLTNINNGIDGLTWWYDEVAARGVPFDLIGLSYYGYWHGTLAALQNAVTVLSDRYDKDVVVVETAYPFTLDDDPAAPLENNIVLPTQLVQDYPATPEGQAANFRAVQDVVVSAPGGRGLGAVYWEPAWTATAGAGWDPEDPASGNAWENQAMFDFDGRALPALGEYAPDPVASASVTAPPSSDAGRVEQGRTSEPQDIVVNNTGAASFTGRVEGITTGDGFAFRPDPADGVITVAPGASASIGTVVFSSATTGRATGSLTLSFTASSSARIATPDRTVLFAGTSTVALSAEGVAVSDSTPGQASPTSSVAVTVISDDPIGTADVSSGRLARTGADVGATGWVAVALLIVGAALAIGSRRHGRRSVRLTAVGRRASAG